METPTWIWSWGAGTHGQLGSGDFADRLKPLRLTSFGDKESALRGGDSGGASRILAVAGGGAHAVALVGSKENARVMTWGNGESGALGHGENSDLCLPKPVLYFQNIQICSVAAGWSHSAFVTDAGDLYTCGAGSFGQLGHGDLQSRAIPTHVKSLAGKPVTLAACGMRHTLVLQGSSGGHAIHAFGSSKRGQLGIGRSGQSNAPHQGKISFPQRVLGFGEERLTQLLANGEHSAALTDDGRVYIWGRGFGNSPDLPTPAEICVDMRFDDVALGWNHCIARTEIELWAWGSNDRGQLGISNSSFAWNLDSACSEGSQREGKQSSRMAGSCQVNLRLCSGPSSSDGRPGAQIHTPQEYTMGIFKVTCLDGRVVKSLSAGAEHSAVVLEDGSVMTWGWGEHGQLGHGDDADQLNPKAVAFSSAGSNGVFTWRTFCGSGFTFAVAEKEVIFEDKARDTTAPSIIESAS